MSFLWWQRVGDARIASDRLVLRAAEVPLLQHALALRDTLERRRDEQVRAITDAIAAGRAEGHAAGLAEGRRAAAQDLADTLQRLAATRVLLGEAVLDDLMSHPESAMPFGLTPCARIESATQVGPALRACGASVLLAALPRGPLRDALCRGLAPVEPSRMSPELAETLIVRARHMGGPHAGGAA